MNFDGLEKLKSFENVERGIHVYSSKYGLGIVMTVYRDNELIVRFPQRQIRICIDDSDLCLVPADPSPRKRVINRMTVNGVVMGRNKMKKFMKKDQ